MSELGPCRGIKWGGAGPLWAERVGWHEGMARGQGQPLWVGQSEGMGPAPYGRGRVSGAGPALCRQGTWGGTRGRGQPPAGVVRGWGRPSMGGVGPAPTQSRDARAAVGGTTRAEATGRRVQGPTPGARWGDDAPGQRRREVLGGTRGSHTSGAGSQLGWHRATLVSARENHQGQGRQPGAPQRRGSQQLTHSVAILQPLHLRRLTGHHQQVPQELGASRGAGSGEKWDPGRGQHIQHPQNPSPGT